MVLFVASNVTFIDVGTQLVVSGFVLAESPIGWLWLLLGGGAAAAGGIWGVSRVITTHPADHAPLKIAPVKPEDVADRLKFVDTSSKEPDDVDVTVFAPDTAPPGDSVVVQVFVHGVEHGGEAERRALKVDPDTKTLASIPLSVPLRVGDKIKVSISGEGASIKEPVQSGVWHRRIICFHFLLTLPHWPSERKIRPILRIFVNGMPAGNVIFQILVKQGARQFPPVFANEYVKPFRKVFLSYASEDRIQVLKAAQLLNVLKMKYFHDLLTLAPGDRWEKKLFSEIEECDAFLLFWSRHAAQSQWVVKEAEYALKCSKDGSPDRTLEIVPIILEGPPPPLPPDSLREIHFNDPVCHVIFSEEALAAAHDTDQ